MSYFAFKFCCSVCSVDDLSLALPARDASILPCTRPSVDHLFFVDKLSEPDESSVETQDSSIVYYVAGYIGRSLAARNKCDSCKTHLVFRAVDLELEDDDQPPVRSDVSLH